MKTIYLIRRNIKLFFKDKGMAISSMITPLILILLYATFLKNVYVDSFHQAIDNVGISISEKYINGFVYGWLFSSLVAVSAVTVSFCSNLLMVSDKVSGAINDFGVAPITKTKIAISYYVASMLVSMIIITIEIIIGFIIMASSGWFLSASDVVMIFVSAFLLVNFGTSLSSIINCFLSSQGQMSAVGTLVSSIYGFICGAYMPINQFGSGLQHVLSFLPGTYATHAIRYSFERGVLNELKTSQGFPSEVVNKIASSFDINISFFNNEIPFWGSIIILASSTVIFISIYILLNVRKNMLKWFIKICIVLLKCFLKFKI